MRAETLLRLSIFVVVLLGAALLGLYAYSNYWGDLRHAVGYGLTAEAMGREGDLRIEGLKDALAIDPTNWLARERLAEQDLFAGRLKEAEAQLRAALRYNPDSPLVNFTMGIVQYREGSIDAATPYFVAAARLDPGNLQYEGMVKQLRALQSGGGQTPATSTSTTSP